MTVLSRISLAALMLAVAGCASSGPRLDPNRVVVYSSVDEIGRDYDVVAPIRPTTRRYSRPSEATVDDARVQAAAMGANGVLIVTEDDAVADARIRQAMSSNESYSRITMLAITVAPQPITAGPQD